MHLLPFLLEILLPRHIRIFIEVTGLQGVIHNVQQSYIKRLVMEEQCTAGVGFFSSMEWNW